MRKNFSLFCIINSFFALLCGAIIYVLFGGNTYIGSVLGKCFNIRSELWISVFARCYFADFLWGYALCFALMSFLKRHFAFFITVFCGFSWELLQYFKIVSGTGDAVDFIMYLTAGITAVLIGKLKLKEGEK